MAFELDIAIAQNDSKRVSPVYLGVGRSPVEHPSLEKPRLFASTSLLY